jgi:hypothetical protein
MKPYRHVVLDLGWTVLYFLYWGGSYGIVLGLVTGTTVVPIFGSVVGMALGFTFSLLYGLILGAGVGLLHLGLFRLETDLALYRRRLARGVGAFTIGYVLFVDIAVLSPISSDPAWDALEWVFILAMMGIELLWAALSSAYTASYYPDWMIKRLIRQKRIDLDPSTLNLETQSATQQMEAFLRRIYPHWMHIAAGVLGVALYLIFLLITDDRTLPGIPRELSFLPMSIFVGLFSCFAFALYCSTGNVFLLVFLKRVVFTERFRALSPHRYRVTLTLTSFFFTLVSTWWLVLFSPICAFYIAYHVYHTLALPNDSYDKAKHKEKSDQPIPQES